MKPFFSVIIPLYNKEKHIKETIFSVLNQSFVDFEVIIVNDGSTDNSLEVVKNINDARVHIYNKTNAGVSSARNYGIKKAAADYIAFLDADDIWDDNFLYEISILISNYPKNKVFSTAAKIKSPKALYNADYFCIPNNEVAVLNYFKASLKHPITHSSSVVINKDITHEIGVFNEDLKTSEDLDYWIRIGLKYPVVFKKTPLITINVTDNSLTKSNRNHYKALDYSKYLKHYDSVDFLEDYINKNIYSSIIKYKLINDKKHSNALKEILNYKKLSLKQRYIIASPNALLKCGVKLFRILNNKKNYY